MIIKRLLVISLLVNILLAINISYAGTPAEYYSSEHRIGMDVVLGFNNSIKQYSYNHAVFFIKNDGKDFSGKLSVKVGAGFARKGPQSVYSKKVFLPELSKKRYYIYFDYQSSSLAAPVMIELKSDAGEVLFSADLVADEKVSVIRSYPVRQGVSGFLTAVISDNSYGYNFLAGVNKTIPSEARKSTAYFNFVQGHSIEYPPYETLPDDNLGYDGVNLVVLSNLSPAKLNFDQKRALIRYVQEGGDLLITKGEKNQWLEDEFLTDLMPCAVSGAQRDVAGIGRYYVENLSSHITLPEYNEAESYSVLDVSVHKNAKSFISFQAPPIARPGTLDNMKPVSIPLVVTKRFGDGRVFVTTFDPAVAPFAGKKVTLDIFSNIFNMLSNKKGMSLDRQQKNAAVGVLNALLDTLVTEDIIKQIGIALIVVFIIYVIVIGPVNYYVLRRKRRLELAWLTIPATAIIFSLIFLVSGYALRGTENYSFSYNVVKIYNGNSFRFSSLLSVFASRADNYDINIERANISVNYFDSGSEKSEEREIEVSDTINVKGVDIKKWSVRNFTMNGYIHEDSDHYFTAEKQGYDSYEIEYDLPFEISKLYIARSNQVHEVKIDPDNAKKGRMKISSKDLRYTSDIQRFSRTEMLFFGMSKDAKDSAANQSRANRNDLLSYLSSKTLYNQSSMVETFFALTRDPILDYTLTNTKFKKIDSTLVIIPVENR